MTGIKQQLGPLINGLVNNEFYIPAASLQFAGTKEFLEEYQKRAQGLGIDPLGFTYPPYAYASGQILAKAVIETKSLDDDKLADHAQVVAAQGGVGTGGRQGRLRHGLDRQRWRLRGRPAPPWRESR